MSKRFLTLIAFSLLIGACDFVQDVDLVATNQSGSQPPAWLANAPGDLRHSGAGPGGLTVMTRNIYIGADVALVLSASSPGQIPVLAAQALQNLLATDFPARARALAEEIAETQPHLIGVQEATTIRIQSPGDADVGGTVAAQDILFDYLGILLQAIHERGLDYRVAASVQNADVELPFLAGTDPLAFNDVRVTDYDVILYRGDVDVSRITQATFDARLAVSELGITVPRGYVAVDATVSGRTYRVVNTHLEPFSLPIRLAQATELISALADERLPVVLLGDLNTPAPMGETYQLLLSNGYEDVWTHSRIPHSGSGFTCCQVADLTNAVSVLDTRVDLILFRSDNLPRATGGMATAFATVVGADPEDRLPSGLWPSDHAGVVAALRIPASEMQISGRSRLGERILP